MKHALSIAVEAVVEFDYQATEEDELNLVKGDVITNVTKMDGGWWEGTLKGKTGMFPDNFVKVRHSFHQCVSILFQKAFMFCFTSPHLAQWQDMSTI